MMLIICKKAEAETKLVLWEDGEVPTRQDMQKEIEGCAIFT